MKNFRVLFLFFCLIVLNSVLYASSSMQIDSEREEGLDPKNYQFSRKISKKLKKLGYNKVERSIAAGCQASLFFSPQDPQDVLKKTLTKKQRKVLRKKKKSSYAGRKILDFRGKERQIHDPKLVDTCKVLTPVCRRYLETDRRTVIDNRDLFSSVKRQAYRKPVPKLTESQRQQRRKKIMKAMAERDKENKVPLRRLKNAEKRELESTESYRKHFEKEKNKIRSKKRKRKIRRSEMIHTYNGLVAGVEPETPEKKKRKKSRKNLRFSEKSRVIIYDQKKSVKKGIVVDVFPKGFVCRTKVAEYTLDFDPGAILLEKTGLGGRTNEERLEDGLCPVDSKGNEFNFHHVTHWDARSHNAKEVDGIKCLIRLLTGTLHREKSGELHFPKSMSQRPRNSIRRSVFDKWRQEEAIPQLLKILKGGQSFLVNMMKKNMDIG